MISLRPRAAFVAAVGLVLAACGGSDGPTTPPGPNQIAAASTTTLTGTVATAVTDVPRVKVSSSTGTAVAGVAVTFTVAEGGGTVTSSTATTDASGIASAGAWTLGTTAGANRLTATAAGISSTITFTATAAAGPPASIAFSRDSVLLDQWGDTVRVTVTVKDAQGNTLSAPTVTWTSPDTAVATVTGGLVSSVRVGRTLLQASATVGTQSFQATIPARVVLQRNSACVAPTTPTRGAALGVPAYSAPEILTNLASPVYQGSRTLALDYDGDADVDAIRLEYSYPQSPAPYTGTMHVFKNDGGILRDSTARVMASTVIPDHPRDFEIADFTGDGVADLYVAQHGYDAAPFPGAPNLFFTRSGNQLAQVASARFAGFSATAFSHGSSAADIDCDGDLDLVELNVNGNAPNYLWLNSGTGNFTAVTSRAPAIAGGTAGQRWQEPAFIDIDRDGDPDMYLGARSGTGWNEDVLLVNDGFGNFRSTTAVKLPAPKFPTAHGVNNAKAADFNGDGLQDLVLFEIPQPFSTSSAIRLWINKGDGSFRDDAVVWGLPTTCTSEIIEPLYVTDFNGDGWPDVAIPGGCPNLGGPGILFNRNGTFEYFAFKNLVSYLEFDIVTPMDINGDGKLDLFFGDRGGNPIIVKRQ